MHGGAGNWPLTLHKQALGGVRSAADLGFDVLTKRGSALDAVEAAVVSMEDNPIFNAGTGSTLNLLGEIETDAAIMDGHALRGGGVALLRNIRNPVKAARIVMDKTDHVLIAGKSAEKLALMNGLERGNLRVPRRVHSWNEGLRRLKSKSGQRSPTKGAQYFLKQSDTVGALALDSKGHLAAADSTGGVSLKLPGRIGDSPILGAGLYANHSGAATATGSGEQAIRLAISKTACDLMSTSNASSAAVKSIQLATRTLGPGIGIINLDRKGRYGVAHNVRNLCWAMKTSSSSEEGMRGSSNLRAT